MRERNVGGEDQGLVDREKVKNTWLAKMSDLESESARSRSHDLV